MSRRCAAVREGRRCVNPLPEEVPSVVECFGAHVFPAETKAEEAAKRVPVDYRYDALNPTFLLWMARIGAYATEKYGDWSQYTHSRLVGVHSPVNHIYEHLRSYAEGIPYDHFDKDVRWHLVAVAYNAMMEFFYYGKFGALVHPLAATSASGDSLRRESAESRARRRAQRADFAAKLSAVVEKVNHDELTVEEKAWLASDE